MGVAGGRDRAAGSLPALPRTPRWHRLPRSAPSTRLDLFVTHIDVLRARATNPCYVYDTNVATNDAPRLRAELWSAGAAKCKGSSERAEHCLQVLCFAWRPAQRNGSNIFLSRRALSALTVATRLRARVSTVKRGTTLVQACQPRALCVTWKALFLKGIPIPPCRLPRCWEPSFP